MLIRNGLLLTTVCFLMVATSQAQQPQKKDGARGDLMLSILASPLDLSIQSEDAYGVVQTIQERVPGAIRRSA